MKYCFVFHHGWGMTMQYWSQLAPYFQGYECHFLESGYFGAPVVVSPEIANDSMIVGVGHSLGLTKLLGTDIQFDCLVGIESFLQYLGYDPQLREERVVMLDAFGNEFKLDAPSRMKQMYIDGFGREIANTIDFNHLDSTLLLDDFELLYHGVVKHDAVPLLVLASEDDMIVPMGLIRDNFATQPNTKIETTNGAGHVLGYNQPEWVYQKIAGFLHDIR